MEVPYTESKRKRKKKGEKERIEEILQTHTIKWNVFIFLNSERKDLKIKDI